MTKKNIMPVVVLTAICLIVAALLAGVNELTKGKIEENILKAEQASLIEVLPGANLFEETEIPAGAPKTVRKIYKETSGVGHVMIMVAEKTSYSSGDMTVSVGISDGKIVGAKITTYNESKDLGRESYPKKFIGTTSDTVGGVELVTDVTYSSTAFRAVMADALAAEALLPGDETVFVYPSFASAGGSSLPESEADFKAEINELLPGVTYTEQKIPEGADSTLKKLFKTSKGGYVCYVVVPGAYVPVATAALFEVQEDGTVGAIKLLAWVVGHGVSEGDFEYGFVGTDIYHVDGVELVTEATGTSVDFRNAVSKTLDTVTDLLGKREDRFLALVDELIPNSEGVKKLPMPDGAPSTLKGLYASEEGRGTVAHIVVPGAYVPVATEALVYFDSLGKIRGIKLMQWVVGHGVGPGDFADGFVGKTAETIEDAELVTAATGTSLDFRNAVAAAAPFIPTSYPVWRVLATVALVACVCGFVTVMIIKSKRRSVK